MRNHLKTFLLGIVLCNMGWIAAQNPAKILAPNYIKANFPNPFTLPQVPAGSTGYHGERPTGAQNIQMDATGQKILFFIIDEHVYSRKGELIGDLPWVDYTAETAPIGMTGEVAIIPSKQCFNEFIILSTYKNLGVTGSSAMYDKIKVEYDANGNLINNSGLYSASLNTIYDQLKIENLIGNDYYATNNVHDERATFAISKMNTNGIRYIFIHNGTKVFRVKIQNGNLIYDNYNIDLVAISQATALSKNPKCYRQEMELITLSNGNLRIAVPVSNYGNQTDFINSNNEGYFIFDYSTSTNNLVPNSLKKILYPSPTNNWINIKGAEFSPNGNRMYFSHQKVSTTGITSTIDMFDLTTVNPYLSKTTVSSSDDYANSQLEIDNQGGLLIPASNRLSRLANCNNPTLPIDFSNIYLSLNNYTSISPFQQILIL